MAKKPRNGQLPSDWRDQLKKEGIFTRWPGWRLAMTRLISEDETAPLVAEAAAILWRKAENRPALREKFFSIFCDALFDLTIAADPRTRCFPPTVRKCREIVSALEFIRDNGPLLMSSSDRAITASAEFGSLIGYWNVMAKEAPKTRPRDTGRRRVLLSLRDLFHHHFGGPSDEAVGLLMEAGFGGSWDVTTVQTRASEWGVKKPERKKLRK